MSFLYLFLSGIIIGSASIIPGLSGSVIAVILGLYDKSINALINIFKNFKQNFIFLFIIASGILVGTIWFGNIILFLYNKNEVITRFGFMGLIMGSIPNLFMGIKKKHMNVNYICIIIPIVLSVLLLKVDISLYTNNYTVSNLFLSGIIYSVGKVIPGISGSSLLMLMGMYNFVLLVVSHPISFALHNTNMVLPFLFGLIIGTIVLIKLINSLLKKHFSITYSFIIGFAIGSALAIIPPVMNIIGIVIIVPSFLLTYLLLKSI